ncbi:DUF4136 domain-containing protein [Alteripontixanthobacter maritimus]|nr:DUF4136 domain-containing protein [Alteripontixanthobacter maritimus]
MKRHLKAILASAAALATLSACATVPRAGPAEVTRFVAPAATAQLGQGTIFIETAPGLGNSGMEMAAYKAAVARELAAQGYRETSRAEADQVAQVSLERVVNEPLTGRRGPVSVGVGGSTGSYGSGVGVGVGINLGGGGPKDVVTTRLGVMIRDKAAGTSLWEGRAGFFADTRNDLAQPARSADALADALFEGFPGRDGETIEVDLPE